METPSIRKLILFKTQQFLQEVKNLKILVEPASIRVNNLKPIYQSQHCIYEQFKMHTNEYRLVKLGLLTIIWTMSFMNYMLYDLYLKDNIC